METMRPADTVTAVRMARGAPAANLNDTAAAAGMSTRRLVAALRTATPRGRCDRALVDAQKRMGAPAAATLDRSFCPPWLIRAADAGAPSGTAGWAARSCDQPGATRAALVDAAVSDNPQIRRTVAAAQRCPAAVLGRLSSDGVGGVRKAAAHNISNRAEFLMCLANDDDTVVRYLATDNPSIPRCLLGLGEDWSDPDARQCVAEDWDCPPAALHKLAASDDNDVQTALSENQTCKPETLDQLADSTDWIVRYNVAMNYVTPTGALDRLAGDDDWDVRCRVAKHQATSIDTLRRLAGDSADVVAEFAAEALVLRDT